MDLGDRGKFYFLFPLIIDIFILFSIFDDFKLITTFSFLTGIEFFHPNLVPLFFLLLTINYLQVVNKLLSQGWQMERIWANAANSISVRVINRHFHFLSDFFRVLN